MTTEEKRLQAHAMLQQELKQLYRKCVDADQKLDQLRKQGMAKFSTLFEQESPFVSQGRHFVDYLPELATDLEQLQQAPAAAWPEQLKPFLQKLQTLHQLLEQFTLSLKEKPQGD